METSLEDQKDRQLGVLGSFGPGVLSIRLVRNESQVRDWPVFT